MFTVHSETQAKYTMENFGKLISNYYLRW